MTIAMSNDSAPAEPHAEGWNLVESLVARRKELKLRQIDVARRMHVGQPTVCQFENGKREPRLSTLIRYARAVDAAVLVDMTDPEDDGHDDDGERAR